MFLSSEQKEIILQLSSDGLKGRKIAELLQVSFSAVYTFLKRNKERGSIENKKSRGRSRKTDERGDRKLFRLVKRERRKPLKELCARFNEENHVHLSARTVYRRLKEEGFKRRVVKKKTVVSRVNRERRRGWCRSRLHFSVDQYWKKFIFSDETQIVIGTDRKVYVWRKDDEIYSPQCLGVHADQNPRCKASVMFLLSSLTGCLGIYRWVCGTVTYGTVRGGYRAVKCFMKSTFVELNAC